MSHSAHPTDTLTPAEEKEEENVPTFPPQDYPPQTVHQKYIQYLNAKQKLDKQEGRPVSAYEGYAQDFKSLIPQKIVEKDKDSFEKAHPLEKFLPKDAKGNTSVYGVHKGKKMKSPKPMQGPADWPEYYPKWQDVGPQLDKSLPWWKALDKPELDFCKNHFGITFEVILGQGSFGTVWRVEWHQKDRLGNTISKQKYACKVVNLKMFKSGSISVEKAVKNMLKESEITKNLKHDNVVSIEHVFNIHDEETGFPKIRSLLFMELCDGVLSNQVNLTGTKFSEEKARPIMIDVCQGLKYLHDNNIVHIDIKPGNILFKDEPDGHRCYKLADYGLSINLSSHTDNIVRQCGTLRYAAPEFNKRPDVDGKKADIFSLGSTLAEMLVGFYQMEDCRKSLWPPDLFNPIPDYRPREMMEIEYRWGLSSSGTDLIRKMCMYDPASRSDIDQVISHQWFTNPDPQPGHMCPLM